MSRTTHTLTAAAMLAATASLATAAPAEAAGVCAGITGCRVVAKVDVDGNGTADPVGLVRTGKDGAEKGRVTLRVKPGKRVVTASRTTEFFYGPLWQGAANVDGRRGKELFVGRLMGAHTMFFSALTLRRGELVELRAPGKQYRGLWVADSSVMYRTGWQRRAADPAGVVRLRTAVRNDPPDDRTFDGVVKTFRWTRDGWVRTAVKRYPHASEERVSGWGGFHIKGLQRF
jgi:hypothetical protein